MQPALTTNSSYPRLAAAGAASEGAPSSFRFGFGGYASDLTYAARAASDSGDGSVPFIRLTMMPRMLASRLGAVPAQEYARRNPAPQRVGVLRPVGSPSATTVTPT